MSRHGHIEPMPTMPVERFEDIALGTACVGHERLRLEMRCGGFEHRTHLPDECWQPYSLDFVLDRYLEMLFGG